MNLDRSTSWSNRRAGSVSPRQRWRSAVAWHFHHGWLGHRVRTRPGKRLHNELENHHFLCKIHYFDWAIFNSYVTNYQRVMMEKYHLKTMVKLLIICNIMVFDESQPLILLLLPTMMKRHDLIALYNW